MTADERVTRVLDFASSIYNDASKVREFMHRPHPILGGQSPLDLAALSDEDADHVIALLGRAAYSGGV